MRERAGVCMCVVLFILFHSGSLYNGNRDGALPLSKVIS